MRKKKLRKDEIPDKYDAWKRAVKKRDGNRCQMPGCNKFSYWNDCHHIRRYSDTPELRYMESNGIVLCKKCHQSITGKEEFYAVMLLGIVHETYKKKLK